VRILVVFTIKLYSSLPQHCQFFANPVYIRFPMYHCIPVFPDGFGLRGGCLLIILLLKEFFGKDTPPTQS
jgi:hypothetical protein